MNAKFAASFVLPMICVATITYLLSLTHPHCEDSTLKSAALVTGLFGQWILFGVIVAILVPQYRIITVFIFATIGLPISAVIWVISLWSPKIFGFPWIPFRMMFPEAYFFTIPLALFGSTAVMIVEKIKRKT